MSSWYPACQGHCSEILLHDWKNASYRQTKDDVPDMSYDKKDWTAEGVNSDWSSLPHHVLLLIFRHFSAQDLAAGLGLVCRRWADAAASPALWRQCPAHIRLPFKLRSKSNSALTAARHRLENWNPKEMSILMQGGNALESLLGGLEFPALRSLDLGLYFWPSKTLVETMASSFPTLYALSMERASAVDDGMLGNLAAALPQLTHLSFSYCGRVSNTGLEHLARGIRSLEMLAVDGQTRITDQGVETLLSLQGKNLRRLYLGGTNLTDETIKAIARHSTQIRLFSISNAQNLTDASIPWLKQLRHSLRHLHLCCGEQLSGKALADLFDSQAGLGDLGWLSLNSCTQLSDEAVDALTTACPTLESLCISGPNIVTAEGLNHISTRLEDLRYLDMAGVTAKVEIGESLPSLVYLDLRLIPTDSGPESNRYDESFESDFGPIISREEITSLVKQRAGKLAVINDWMPLCTLTILEALEKREIDFLPDVSDWEDRDALLPAFARHGEETCCMNF